MNHLVAKVKGVNGDFFKVILNKEIFKHPVDLNNPKPYNAEDKLESDEWFAVDKFSEQKYCIDFLKKNFNSTEYIQIEKSNFNKIDYLCAYQSGIYYFQKVGSKHFIHKRLLSLNTFSITDNEPIIIINSDADALYINNEDRLYFKNLTTITTIFKGIEILYRTATNEETETFLQNSFIKLDKAYTADKVKIANRKRIALAMDTLNKFSAKDKKSIFKYIQDYCIDLQFDPKASNFTIESEEDLKKLLYGIEQRYYTTPLGGEKRVANSITKIEINT